MSDKGPATLFLCATAIGCLISGIFAAYYASKCKDKSCKTEDGIGAAVTLLCALIFCTLSIWVGKSSSS